MMPQIAERYCCTMRTRLIALIPALALILGATACHENLSVYDVCNAFRAGEHWTLINYKWAFGVYYCRATTSAGGFDEYCIFPIGDDPHWPYVRRECDWDLQAADVETIEEEAAPDSMLTHFVPD